MVEVIKQIEPGSMMATAKPRLQGEVYSPKSCDPGREEGDGVPGLFKPSTSLVLQNYLTIRLATFVCFPSSEPRILNKKRKDY